MKSRVPFASLLLLVFYPSHSALAQKAMPESQSLAQEITAAQRDGLPVSAKDMQKPLPPSEHNAAPVYAQLMQLLKDRPLSEADGAPDRYRGGRQPFDATQAGMIRRALSDRADVVALIHKAASYPKCVFVRNWRFGIAVLFPEFARLRSAARWLSAESALRLYAGKPLEAVRIESLGFNVARHAASDPILISYLVGVAVDAITLAGMERILYVAGNDAFVADAVRQAVEREGAHLDPRTALRGEVGMGLITIEAARKDRPGNLAVLASDDTSPAVRSALAAIKTRGDMDRFLDRSAVIYLRWMRRFLRVAEQPYPQAKSALSAFEADKERHKDDPAFVFLNLFLPLYKVGQNQARSEATIRTVRAAAAVLAWKARHGALPRTLAQVLKPVPIDPFNGQPLRYRQEGKGFVIYSVGESGKFDGGRPDAKPKTVEVLLRYPMPGYLTR